MLEAFLRIAGSRRFGRGLLACALGGATVAVLVSPGCKKKQQDPQYPHQSTVDAAAPLSDGGGLPDAAPPLPDAGAPADAGNQPLDLVTMQTMQDLIKARAAAEAKGMKQSGVFFGANVPEGGVVEQIFMIDSGRCYSVVGTAGPSVTELDIQIQAKGGLPIPLPGPILAVDSKTGPEASISPCWKNPFPLSFPATAVIKATRGYGPIGGQIYVK